MDTTRRSIISSLFATAVRGGYLDLPTGPGLGIELDDHAIESKLSHDWRNQESYDAEDGSVVDW